MKDKNIVRLGVYGGLARKTVSKIVKKALANKFVKVCATDEGEVAIYKDPDGVDECKCSREELGAFDMLKGAEGQALRHWLGAAAMQQASSTRLDAFGIDGKGYSEGEVKFVAGVCLGADPSDSNLVGRLRFSLNDAEVVKYTTPANPVDTEYAGMVRGEFVKLNGKYVEADRDISRKFYVEEATLNEKHLRERDALKAEFDGLRRKNLEEFAAGVKAMAVEGGEIARLTLEAMLRQYGLDYKIVLDKPEESAA